MRLKKPEARLRFFTNASAGKRHDDASGGSQPSYKLESMKIIMEFPKPKNPDEQNAIPENERKQASISSINFYLIRLGQQPQDTVRILAVAGCHI